MVLNWTQAPVHAWTWGVPQLRQAYFKKTHRRCPATLKTCPQRVYGFAGGCQPATSSPGWRFSGDGGAFGRLGCGSWPVEGPTGGVVTAEYGILHPFSASSDRARSRWWFRMPRPAVAVVFPPPRWMSADCLRPRQAMLPQSNFGASPGTAGRWGNVCGLCCNLPEERVAMSATLCGGAAAEVIVHHSGGVPRAVAAQLQPPAMPGFHRAAVVSYMTPRSVTQEPLFVESAHYDFAVISFNFLVSIHWRLCSLLDSGFGGTISEMAYGYGAIAVYTAQAGLSTC